MGIWSGGTPRVPLRLLQVPAGRETAGGDHSADLSSSAVAPSPRRPLMSDTSTVITPEYFQYVAEHTVREDSFLRELKTAATAAGMPPIWIAPEQASLMQILLRAV